MLSSAMGDKDNEEELNTLLRKMASGNYRKEDKANLEAEIAMRSKIRNEFENAKDKNSDKEVLMINFLKDSFSNSMVFPAITDAPLNMVLHIMDKFEAEQFNGVKNQQLKDLKEELKIAKARNNTSDEVEITKSILRLESQEAVITSYENKSVIPFEGVYGGVLKDAYKFTESAAKAVRNLDITSIPISDVFLGTGLLGLSQPEVNKIARMYNKRATYEQEFKDKIKEIEEKKQNKLRGIK
jgi:stress response protein YsnF